MGQSSCSSPPRARSSSRGGSRETNAVRVRTVSPSVTNSPRLIARTVEIKARFGEFAVRLPYGEDWIGIDPAWLRRNVVTRPVPILGPVTCNRRLFPRCAAPCARSSAGGCRASSTAPTTRAAMRRGASRAPDRCRCTPGASRSTSTPPRTSGCADLARTAASYAPWRTPASPGEAAGRRSPIPMHFELHPVPRARPPGSPGFISARGRGERLARGRLRRPRGTFEDSGQSSRCHACRVRIRLCAVRPGRLGSRHLLLRERLLRPARREHRPLRRAGHARLCHDGPDRGRRHALPHAGHRPRPLPALRARRAHAQRRRAQPGRHRPPRRARAADWQRHRQQRRTAAHQRVHRAGTSAWALDRLVQSVSPDARAGRFASAPGCATFPEVEVNVTGQPFKGPSPTARVRGFVDDHIHIGAFQFLGGRFHCGRPWSPYGVTVAMQDCADHDPNGSAAVAENFFSAGTPAAPTAPKDGRASRAGRATSRSPTRAPTGSGSSARGERGCASWSTTSSRTARSASSTRSSRTTATRWRARTSRPRTCTPSRTTSTRSSAAPARASCGSSRAPPRRAR